MRKFLSQAVSGHRYEHLLRQCRRQQPKLTCDACKVLSESKMSLVLCKRGIAGRHRNCSGYLSVIIQHLLELLMIQSDELAYLTDLSGSRGRTSGETALSAHSEEHEVF